MPLHAEPQRYEIDSRHTFPGFEIRHLQFSTQRGRFNRTSGTVTLDAAARRGSVDITIAADSLDTGLEALETELKKPEWFAVKRHPEIRYRSDRVVFEGDKPVAVEGQITLRGITRPLRLDIGYFECGIHPVNLRRACGADATGTLRRSDFGMKAFLPALPDEVKLLIQVEAFRASGTDGNTPER